VQEAQVAVAQDQEPLTEVQVVEMVLPIQVAVVAVVQ
jgi:hypothetical protein